MMITVSVNVKTYKAAEKLAQERCFETLEEVLSQFVYDMAEGSRRSGSWEEDTVYSWINCHYGPLEWLREQREQQGGQA